MKFDTKEQLLEQLKKDGVCDEFLAWCNEQSSLEDIFENCCKDLRVWALCNGHEQFIQHCDWTKLRGYHCDLSKLNGEDWSNILREQPHLAEHCDWSMLSDDNWSRLLEKQPHFEKHRKKYRKQ